MRGLIPRTGDWRNIKARRVSWDRYNEARNDMTRCFYTDGEEMANGVHTGRMELWEIDHSDWTFKRSWAIIEVMQGMLFVWCYAGHDSKGFIEFCRHIARGNRLAQVSFFSRHKGARRMWKHCNPRMIPTNVPDEVQYVFEVPA